MSQGEAVLPGAVAASSKLSTVIDELAGARRLQRRLAIAFGVVATIFAISGVIFLAFQAVSGLDRIDHAADEGYTDATITAQTAFLVVRGTGLAAIVGGVVYYTLSLARSAVDQATRYEKRLIASHLIDYSLHAEEVDAAKLSAAHQIIEVWGSTVESAYTPPRVAKRIGGMKFSIGRDSGAAETDTNQA